MPRPSGSGADQPLVLVPAPAPLWAAAAAVGGVIGAGVGSRKLSPAAIRKILALVLLIAAGKLIVSM